MKTILIVMAGLLVSYSSLEWNSRQGTDESPIVSDELLHNPASKYIAKLSTLDESKFPKDGCDSINNISWEEYRSLPDIEGIRHYEDSGGKYVCNKTYSENFKSYILATSEGGDCGHAIVLITCKGDSVIGEGILFQDCGWENGTYGYTATYLNDSTFVSQFSARGPVIDSTGTYIRSIESYRLKVEKYGIGSHGDIRLLARTDSSWQENNH